MQSQSQTLKIFTGSNYLAGYHIYESPSLRWGDKGWLVLVVAVKGLKGEKWGG